MHLLSACGHRQVKIGSRCDGLEIKYIFFAIVSFITFLYKFQCFIKNSRFLHKNCLDKNFAFSAILSSPIDRNIFMDSPSCNSEQNTRRR